MQPFPKTKTCHDCVNFIPDKIGDGAGIGKCQLGAKSTNEPYGKMPLYRHAPRHCAWFSVKQKNVNKL